MANLKSSIKAIRVTKRRTVLNKNIKETYRAVARDIKKSLESNDVKAAEALVSSYQSTIDKAVKKGVIKKNTGARNKSRMVQRILAVKNK